ncbi:hypothetical protein [Amycolatopsis sp. lyj-23]
MLTTRHDNRSTADIVWLRLVREEVVGGLLVIAVSAASATSRSCSARIAE